MFKWLMNIAEAGTGLPSQSELNRHHNYIMNGIYKIQQMELLESKKNNLINNI